jgi:hypothetical protein
VRLKGHHRGGLSKRLRALHSGTDHGPMAAMNTVKIADGDDRTAQAIGRLTVAHDEEAFRRHVPSKVKKSCRARCRGDATQVKRGGPLILFKRNSAD